MSFVIQGSKFSKIFCIRDWMQKCLDDPKLITADEPFTVTIPRSAGAITLRHRVPVHAATLLPQLQTIMNKKGESETVRARVQGDDEVRNLVPWLTGGPDGQQFVETDRWGVVELPLAGDYVNLQAEYLSQEAMVAAFPEQAAAVEESRKKIQAMMRSSMKGAMERAIALSDERVIRAIKTVYRNFYAQNRVNLENGSGRVMPTDVEKLVAFYLHDAIQKKTDSEKEMMSKVRAVTNYNVTGA